MKTKASVFLAGIFMSCAAFADATFMVSNQSESERWYVYPETFQVFNDGYSVLMSKRNFATDGTRIGDEHRFYAGISNETCRRGYGPLVERQSINGTWRDMAQVQITGDSVTVADHIAKQICEHGATLRNVSKSKSKNLPSENKDSSNYSV